MQRVPCTDRWRSLRGLLRQLCLVTSHHFDKVGVLGCGKDDLDVEGCLPVTVLLQCLEELIAGAVALAHKSFNVLLQKLLVLVIDLRVPS